ncbi:MAG: tetratricopeptide repeat protein, partial [Sphaerochaetaceae bacterium]|nr:tetratricopeptide repeat protein [Sphaerochaetaceae bacterium]
KALDLLVGYEFTPCEGGEHAISDEYLYAKEKIALSHYEKGEYEKAIEVLKSALTIPENLGGGVWHQVKLIAFWYYLGCCYRKLDDSLKAKQYFLKASSFPIDYFTDMYFLPHRLYLGKALIALGKKEEGEKRIEEFKKIIEENLAQKDFGYFATTPFFDSFIENPCEARRKVFGRYRRMCDTIIE